MRADDVVDPLARARCPGATRAIAASRLGSRRGSSSARRAREADVGRSACASVVLRSAVIEPRLDRLPQRLCLRKAAVCHARWCRPGRRRGSSPSFAHSSSRRSACVAGRSRPVRPISPNAASRFAHRLRPSPRRRSRARPARSAPGSSIRTPPATFTKTSAWPSATPAWRESTATIIASRFGSTPVPTRRGIARSVGETSAWISSRIGRVPSSAHATAAPGSPVDGAPEELGRVGDADEPRAGHLEHAELVRRAEAVLRPRAGCGARGSGRPRTGARSRRGARARAGRRRSRPSSRGRRGSSRRPTPSRRAAGARPPRAPARPSRARSRARTSRASARSRSRTRRAARARASRTRSRARSRRGSRPRSAPPSRAARSFTCATDSSPVTRSARRVGAHRAAAPSAAASTCRRPARRRRGRARPGRARRRARGRAPGRRCDPRRPPRRRRRRAAGAASRGAVAARDVGRRLLDQRPERAAAGALAEPAPGGVAALRTRI